MTSFSNNCQRWLQGNNQTNCYVGILSSWLASLAGKHADRIHCNVSLSYLIYCRLRKMPMSVFYTLMKPFLMCGFDFPCLQPATAARHTGIVLLVFVHCQSSAALQVVANGKWAALMERFPSWYPKALWQWPLIHPFPRQIIDTSLSNKHLEALEVRLVKQNGNIEWQQILPPENSKLDSVENSLRWECEILHKQH